MNYLKTSLILLVLCITSNLVAQDDLMNLIQSEDDAINYVPAAFKGTKIISGHSTKTKSKGELDFLIYHRFGPVNSGIQEFFGLDQANIRLGFEYGIIDQLNIGIGRSSFENTYDGYIKWKFLRQKTGAQYSPLNMVWLSTMAINTDQLPEEINTVDRIGYTHELLLSRKFNEVFTFQIMPGMVHLNAVPETTDDNDIFYLGAGYRIKLTSGIALTGEYYYRFNPLVSVETYDALGIGVDIETGGHVFQLHLTNARPTYEKGFITDTRDNFWDGDIRFGFNISRTFQLGQKR